MRLRTILVVVVVLAVGAVVLGTWSVVHKVAPFLQPDECTATVGGRTVTLSTEQARNAALIAAVAVGRGLPAHAATIALATAMQESKLYNLTAGDRDSVGLFQQRPSQGWGTVKQISDPVFATNAFYDALEKLGTWDSITVTEAAQAVQHSAYPDAYAEHEPDARAFASALTGYSPHAFACRIDPPAGRGAPGQARDEVASIFGLHPVVRGSSLTVPVSNGTNGWAVAQYLVAQGQRFGIRRVQYDGWTWSGDETWSHSGGGSSGEVVASIG